MFGFLVRGGSYSVAINFNQHEAGRIIGLLNDIESRDTGFLAAFGGVEDRGLLERLDTVRFHVDMNMHDEHGGNMRQTVSKLKSARLQTGEKKRAV